MRIAGRETRDLVALTVLALLRERPLHPYEIQRVIRERRKDFAMGTTRALYHAVGRLERAGLIEPLETSREGRRPERTVYRLTEAGVEELVSWLDDLVANPVAEQPVFSAAVSFLPHLPADQAVRALRARTVALEGRIAGLRASVVALQDQLHLPRLVLLEHELALAMLEAELAWVRSLAEEVRAGTIRWDGAALAEMFDAHHHSEEIET